MQKVTQSINNSVGFFIALFLFLAPIQKGTQGFKSLAFAVMVLYLVFNGKALWSHLKKTPPYILLMALTVLVIVSLLYTVSWDESWRAFRKDWLKWIVICCTVSLYCATSTAETPARVKPQILLAGSVSAISLFIALYAMGNYVLGIPDESSRHIPHAFTLTHVGLSKYLLCALPFTYLGCFDQEAGKGVRWFCGIASVLVFTAIFMCISRAGWAAALLGFAPLPFLLIKNGNKKLLGLGAALLVAICIVSAPRVVDRLKSAEHGRGVSISEWVMSDFGGPLKERPTYWRVSADIIRDNPFLGTGFGWHNFKQQFKEYYPHRYSHREVGEVPSHPHNVFVSFAVQLGLLGAGLLAVFFAVLFVISTRKFRSDTPCHRLLGALMLSFLLSFHLMGLVEEVLAEQEAVYLFAFVGAFLGIGSTSAQSQVSIKTE